MEEGLRWAHTEADLVPGYGDGTFPSDFGEIESALYQAVTRRFIRAGVAHEMVYKNDKTNAETVKLEGEITEEEALTKAVQSVKVYGASVYDSLSPIDNAIKRAEAARKAAEAAFKEEDITELKLVKGILSVEDANKYGVICILSNTLRSLPVQTLLKYGMAEEADAPIGRVDPTVFNDMRSSLGGQLSAIQQRYTFIRWYVLTDGSFYFYHVRDKEADLWMDEYIDYMRKKNAVPLPAIYDMTPSGMRTIRCPFITFLSPMTTVLFQSRYSVGDFTGFFYPVKTHGFLVILASIDFSTTGDENTMELKCVDIPADKLPKVGPDGRIIAEIPVPFEAPEVAGLRKARNLEWEEKELIVMARPIKTLDETDGFWSSIVADRILPALDRENFEEELAAYGETEALLALKEWNAELWDDNMTKGFSTENTGNGIGVRTETPVPWLYEGQTVKYRWPVRPDPMSAEQYPDDKKVTP
jgi:hypothetical protein